MKLGVFDSGIGGEAIARSLQQALPEAEVITVHDKAHMPYGSRTEQEIITLTDAAVQPLMSKGCDAIVIACNTATTVALPTLRQTYPTQKFIGIEPMIKPAAAQTKTNVIAVCATPRTLASERYAELKTMYAHDIAVIEPDCSDWAYMIENGSVNRQLIKDQIDMVINQNVDVIVLGCTHYHWIKELVEHCVAGRAIVLEPSDAIAKRVRTLLEL